MKPDKEQFRYASPSFTSGGDLGSQAAQLFKLLLVIVIEAAAFVLHYSAFSQTLNMGGSDYLVDIPGISWLFQSVPDAQVNHLVIAFLAMASVAAPVALFFYLLRERVIAEPEEFFCYPPNRIYLGLLVAFYGVMLSVELVNVLALIESWVTNPFTTSDMAKEFRKHESLALLSTVVIAITNAAVALFTAKVWTAILPKKGL